MISNNTKPTPPAWGEELSARYKSGIAHAFLLHNNTQDYVAGVPGQDLRTYLQASFADRHIVVYWNRSGGFSFLTPAQKRLFAEVVGLVQPKTATPTQPAGGGLGGGLAAGMNAAVGAPSQEATQLAVVDQMGRQPTAALGLLNQLLHYKPEKLDEAKRATLLQETTMRVFREFSNARTTWPSGTEYQALAVRMEDYNAHNIETLVEKAAALRARASNRLSIADALKQAIENSPNLAGFRCAVILDYAETVVPATDAAASPEDRTALVTLAEWGRDPMIAGLNHILITIVSELHDLNERLRRSGARWEQIRLPFPSFEERVAFVKRLMDDDDYGVHLAPDMTYEAVARLTTGLRFIDLEDIVLRASFLEQAIDKEMVKRRKDEIVASEFEEVLQVMESEEDFDSIGGLEEVKEDLRRHVITPMQQGNLRLVPQGILLLGPAGTGKSKLARALSKEAGVTFVELQPSKIFSKWVGDTERRLERALSAIQAMTPCAVFIDEIDQAVSRGESGDNGVSNRVFKRLMEVMADTRLRGKVLWLAASNRPDLLDAALLRPGRFDKKVPILAPDARERACILRVLTQEAFCEVPAETIWPTDEEYATLAEKMEQYTGAEIEVVVGKAAQIRARVGSQVSIAEALEQAYERIIPTTQDIDRMTRLALLYCNDLDLVPSHLRELARQVRHPASQVDRYEDETTVEPMKTRRRRDF